MPGSIWIVRKGQEKLKPNKRMGKEGKGMKRSWKKLAAAAAVLLAAASAAGCGKSQGATTAQKEFVYVPEFVNLPIEDNMDQMTVAGDTIYFVSGRWDDELNNYQNYLGKIKVGETTPEKVLLAVSEDENIMRSSIKEDGSLLAVVSTYLYEDAADSSADGQPDGESGAAGQEETGAEAGDAADGAEDKTSEKETEESGKETQGENGDLGAESSETAQSAPGSDTGDTDKEGGGSESASNGADGENAGSEEEETESAEGGSTDTAVVSEGSSTTVILSTDGSEVHSFAVAEAATEEIAADGDYRVPVGQKTELWKIASDGNVTEKIDLNSILDNPNDFYVQYLTEDKDGNIYVGYDQSVIVMDKEGKKLFDLKADNWINSLFATKSGEVLITYWNQNFEVHTIDVAGKKIGDKVEALSSMGNGNFNFAQGVGTDLLFSVNGNLYTYNFGDEKPQEVLNWIDADIDEGRIQSFTMLEDGRILIVTSGWDGESDTNQVEMIYLTKKKGSEVPEKKIITYGTLMLDYNVRNRILAFNRTNQEYRIEVKEYYTDMAEDAYSNAVAKMNADIVSGQCPDIIDLSHGVIQSYVAKGIVEDLYPFMDKDEEINREDYLENVRKAYEINGKLYALPPDFFISTVLGKVSDVGDRHSITLDDVMKLSEGLPEGAELYQYASKSSVLQNIMRMNMDVFVNWETGECKFNSEEFVKALEFANSFPKEVNWEAERPSTPTRIREGKLIMMDASVSSMQEYQMYKGMFGEPVAFVGYPTSKESGSCIISNGALLGMSSKSPYQDGVWQFIKTGITKEAQEKNSNYRYGFPVMKSALEKQFAEDMEEEYYEGADGEKVKQPKTTWGYDDFQIEIYAATEEEVSAVRELIESVDIAYQYDMQMFSIIEEETGAFFEGQKSAKEVADIIQSRVQIYVNENR